MGLIMEMNVSEYLVQFFVEHNIQHFFGYQGTMIAYLVDAICRNKNAYNHSCYNEQAASFAACGFSKVSGKCSVAYATSGPGAINLCSGIANAYFDSLPVIFITGQINTYEYENIGGLRQHGFQEIDIVNIVSPICKYAVTITDERMVCAEIEKAYSLATSGRPGPVVLDIPMNIQRAEFKNVQFNEFNNCEIKKGNTMEVLNDLKDKLLICERPVIMVGNGVRKDSQCYILNFARELKIPIVTSLLARDMMLCDEEVNFGYIGAAYGMRIANLMSYKADLLICLGISLCSRQIGTNKEKFAPNAEVFRIDIELPENNRKIKENEKYYIMDVNYFIKHLYHIQNKITPFLEWFSVASECRKKLSIFDDEVLKDEANVYVKIISDMINEESVISCDVGQHMMWVAQSFLLKKKQRLLFSGGHGAMGFALPAAIGAYYVLNRVTYCISGDGAFQMNIQELQWIVRENLPIKIIIFNNRALGMIRFLQNDYFDGRFEGTTTEGNYKPCDFFKVGKAYGLCTYKVETPFQLVCLGDALINDKPTLIEVILPDNTNAFPKTFLGDEFYNQRPYLPDNLLIELLKC